METKADCSLSYVYHLTIFVRTSPVFGFDYSILHNIFVGLEFSEIYYRLQTKLLEGNVFTPVRDSVHYLGGGGVSQHAMGRGVVHFLQADTPTPRQTPPRKIP